MGIVNDFNKELSRWFNKHGVPCLRFVEGEDFCYYHNLHIAQWGCFVQPNVDNYLKQFFYEYGLRADVHIFVISLIHEVGHYMTLHYFEQSKFDADIAAKNIRAGEHGIETNYWYWELPTEFAANMWAIDWMNEHPQEAEELGALCEEWMVKIFDDTDVKERLAQWQDDMKSGVYVPLCLEDEYD